MTHFLIDSDVLIDFNRGVEQAAFMMDSLEEDAPLGISAITRMEVLTGCRNKEELRHFERLLRRFKIFPLTETIGRTADDLLLTYCLSHGLLIPDALIAATALVHQISLLTKNHRDFRFISGLGLIPYPTAPAT